jgi:hypothetical protein
MGLSAKVIRANGTIEDLGILSPGDAPLEQSPPPEQISQARKHADAEWYRRQCAETEARNRRQWLLIGLLIGLVCAALAVYLHHLYFGLILLFILGPVIGIATNAGVAYMAADFASGGASPRISAFNFQDSGTGATAAAITDTVLQTPTGNARVAGVQTTPGSTNVYKTVATLSYAAGFAITEWGLFSASTSGTLWDRRVFSAINVLSGDAIQFSYSLTIPSGGT